MIQDIKKSFRKVIYGLFYLSFPVLLFSFTAPHDASLSYQNDSIEESQIKIVITKNTTEEELEKFKQQMETEGFGFQYSGVAYNEKNEIIAITIQYKDANNNSSKYSVSSKNPISTIVIISDGSHISVKTEGTGNQAFINQGSKNQIAEEDNLREQHRQAMKDRSEQMEKEMEARMQAMEKRHEERKKHMLERRDSILNSQQAQNNQNESGKYQSINKNTTNEELLELQKSYGDENISFAYKNVKRNEKGEITKISITIDNRHGSVSSSTFGNGDGPINEIQLMVDATNTIMKSVER